MKKYVELIEKIISIMNAVQIVSKQPKDFGINMKLFPSEIHMIEAISNHENSNASELSKKLGITNGAVNQVTAKLIKKGLVEQYRTVDNKKEVFYRLTKTGEKANGEHNSFHKEFYDKLINKIPENDLYIIHGFMDDWLKTLKEYSEKNN